MAQTNVNQNNQVASGNMGVIGSFEEPQIPIALVWVPKGTSIPAAQMIDPVTFATYVAGKMNNDTRSQRWFAHTFLDEFKDNTKAPSSEDTGLVQNKVTSYNPNWSFRVKGTQGNMGNYIESRFLQNAQGKYDVYPIDTAGTWQGCLDTSGGGALLPKTPEQIFIPDMKAKTDKTENQYMVEVQFGNRKQFNENYRYYKAGTDPASLVMLQNGILNDVSATLGTPLSITTTTTIVCTAKYGQDSSDLFGDFGTVLTAACFTAKNLTLGTTLTISTVTFGTIVVAGQTYNYGKFVLSAAPTATNVVQISLAAPSVVNAVFTGAGANALNVVVEIINANANAQNAAVHTF